MSRALQIGALLFLLSAVALAKDDTPNPRQLAIDHPWHPTGPALTEIELRCGDTVERFELRSDARGWHHLVSPTLEALATPSGRYLRREGTWRRVDEATWLASRTHELGLRELVGGPLLPEAWRVEEAKSDARAVLHVTVSDAGKKRTLDYDAVQQVWTGERGALELAVKETTRFGKRMLPAVVTVSNGCVMSRRVQAKSPSMPSLPAVD